ncbi:phosphate transport system regulatory protein PhoU [Lachnospiraceae bacterium OM04-12BH]|nr:phosphate transport system regulatory protein PhoU [Lachnospiraceae bacterium OM04-12BH]
MSPRTTFINELNQLKENVADMATRVEKNYETLFEAYEKKEKAAIEKIVAVDKDINRRQREIESECLFLITKQQPIVSDLRAVTASLKVVTDIERVGDHVADIAELLIRMDMKELSAYSVHLNPMIRETRDMLRMAVDAFTGGNKEEAQEVIQKDDVVDELFNAVKNDVIESLKKETRDADECVDILMIAKYLEKIGDHAVNICEWEIFKETGNISDMRLL